MTYGNASQWAIDNVPMFQYEDYDDWLNAVKEEIETPNLFKEKEFIDKLKDAWRDNIGDITKSKVQIQEDEIQERQEALEQTTMPEFRPARPRRLDVEQQQRVEQPRQLPPTGQAPIVTTRKFDMTPPPVKEGILARIRKFLSRRK